MNVFMPLAHRCCFSQHKRAFDLEKVMNIVDHQRMDILDTLIR